MKNVFQVTVILACVVVFTGCGGAGSEGPLPIAHTELNGSVIAGFPSAPNVNARYLIYLHGAIIETGGMRPIHPSYGTYEYAGILQTFADRGFTVISEVRQPGSAPDREAQRVASQVQGLLDTGVPARSITVVGFSKGGVIAALASAKLLRDDVGWVILAGCGQWVEMLPDSVPHGRLLSLFDRSDTNVGSCDALLSRMPEGSVKVETILELGTGHGAFYTPNPAWIEPVIEWAGL